MTDKELFKKTEEVFNLNKNAVNECYKNGQFAKIINEELGSRNRRSNQVGGRGGRGGRGGGLFGSIARGIGNVVASPFKLAGAAGKGYRDARAEVAELNTIRQKAKQAKLDTKIKNQAYKQSKNATKYGGRNSEEDLKQKQNKGNQTNLQDIEKTNQAGQTTAQARQTTAQSKLKTNAQRDANKQTNLQAGQTTAQSKLKTNAQRDANKQTNLQDIEKTNQAGQTTAQAGQTTAQAELKTNAQRDANKPTPAPAVIFKVGDEVFIKTTKNPKALGVVSAILDKPGFVQVKVNGGAAYAFDKRNVTLKRGINKESYKRRS
jgi:hypothetical protein